MSGETTSGSNFHITAGAKNEDVDTLAAVLADAFHEHGEFEWLVPDEQQRSVILRAFFRGQIMRVDDGDGDVLVLRDNNNVLGVSIWAGPKNLNSNIRERITFLRALFGSQGFGLGTVKALARFSIQGIHLDKVLASGHPDYPHRYLAGIGVRRRAHGTGAGGAMLREGLRRADEAQEPVYLECVERLASYYERYAFEIVGTLEIGRGCPTNVGMIREAS